MSNDNAPPKYFVSDMKELSPDWAPVTNDEMISEVKRFAIGLKARSKAVIVKECETYAQLWEECARKAWVPTIGCKQQLDDRWKCMKDNHDLLEEEERAWIRRQMSLYFQKPHLSRATTTKTKFLNEDASSTTSNELLPTAAFNRNESAKYDSAQRYYEPRFNNDPLRDSGSALEPDLALVEQKKMISEQSKTLDEILTKINASSAQLNTMAEEVKNSSQTLEASQDKTIQPVYTLLQALSDDLKKYYAELKSNPPNNTARAEPKEVSAEGWHRILSDFTKGFEKTFTKLMTTYQKQQDKKLVDFMQNVTQQLKDVAGKERERNQIQTLERAVVTCLSHNVVVGPQLEVSPVVQSNSSAEQTQVIDPPLQVEHALVQPSVVSSDGSDSSQPASRRNRRKSKALIRDLPIMGSRECIEQSQLLSQVFDCDDSKGRYNLRRRAAMPVLYDDRSNDNTTSPPVKAETVTPPQEHQPDFPWWDVDDSTQMAPRPPVKRRGRKRKARHISKPPALVSSAIVPIETLCHTAQSLGPDSSAMEHAQTVTNLGPVPLENCPDEVDGDFNWVRVFHKVQKLM